MNEPLVDIRNLTVEYLHHGVATAAVKNVSLAIQPGESVGLVGESGSGKSTLALALIGLLPERESRTPQGEIGYKGQNLLTLPKEDMRRLRGRAISMIFQDPFSSLNPVMTIDEQIQETLHLDGHKKDAGRATRLLEEVQLSDPRRMLESYPHQLSGGQRQRVLMAMALARSPDLLIADEPTTALDVIVQDDIIKLLLHLRKTRNMAMLFVTHNIGLVKMVSERVAVMSQGELVEQGPTDGVLYNPQHPYTRNLLKSIPRINHETPY